MEKTYETIGGMERTQRGGKNNLICFVKNMLICSEPKTKEFNNRKFLEFLSNIQGDYSTKLLTSELSDNLDSNKYGMSVKISIDCTHPKREAFLKDRLKKGNVIQSGMISLSTNTSGDRTYLNGYLNGFGYVKTPGPAKEEVEGEQA